MQNWDDYLNNDKLGHLKNHNEQCNVYKDFSDAKKIADLLNIKIYKIDFIKDYWNKVFKYTIKQYKKGLTPNPDILCNKYIKFDKFLNYAKNKFNADYVAMGHYATIKTIKGVKYLGMSKDTDHDQTYFLCGLEQKQINDIVFPIGKYTKDEVRKIAKENNLPVWNRKNSTGICFIGERKFNDFLENYISTKEGEIKEIETNKTISKHKGIMYYTLGQNKDLGLSGCTERKFVCKKDIKNNILYVCNKKNIDKYLGSEQCIVQNFNWINSKAPINSSVYIRFRHRQKLIKGNFSIKNNKIILNYAKTYAVTPGQYAVLYQGKICLGGGEIEKILK